MASHPLSVDGSAHDAKARAVGRGCNRRVADVMTASVPSLPTTSGIKLGPFVRCFSARTSPVLRHALEREHHVLDLPVVPGRLPGAPGRDPASDGAAEDRRREVPEGEAAPIELLFERHPHRPRFDVERRRRRRIERAPTCHPLQIDYHDVLSRQYAGAHAAPRAERDQRCSRRGGPRHELAHLAGRLRPHDRAGAVLGDVPRAHREVVPRP